MFKFTYGGRRYDRLSLSEKIRAGLEVSELVKRLTGRNYPVFVDNMESVDDLANVRPTGQIIMAKCVRGAELTVRPMGRPQVQKGRVTPKPGRKGGNLWPVPLARSPLWTRPDGVGSSSTPGRCGERRSRRAAPSAW